MSDIELPEEDQPVSGGSLRAWHFAVIAIVALGAVAGYYYWSGRGGENLEPPPVTTVAEVPEGSRTVTLYFAAEDEPELVSETRQVAISTGFVEQVGQVVKALLAGPERGGISTIPEGTEVLAVFYDADNFTVYVDFSGELIAGHPGGSTAEYFTIAAIMKTISENFPEVVAVQILIEGSQVNTIAGHIDANRPLLVRNWR